MLRGSMRFRRLTDEERLKLLDRLSKLDAAVPGGLISLLKRMESEEREVN